MEVSQQLNHVNDDTYDDDITVSGIEKGHFPAVTSTKKPEGSNTREITVEIMALEQAPGGTMQANPGLYRRQPDEIAVKVTVMQNGQEMANNTTNYS